MIRYLQEIHWYAVLDVAYHLLAYALLFAGVWLVVKKPILSLFSTRIKTARIPSLARKIEQEQREKNRNRWNRHLDMLLQSTIKRYDVSTLSQFYASTFGTILVTSIGFFELTRDWKSSLFYAGLSGMIPYAALSVKLSRSRAKASHELLPAANKLLQKYRANQHNLYFALLEVVEDLDGPIRQAFFTIIHSVQNRKSLEDAVMLFHYQIKTSWSLQLGILILDGIMENKTIDNGLARMIHDLTETTIILEKEKSENRDAIQLGYFPIVALPLSIVINQKISGGRAFHFTFETPEGRQMLIFAVLVCSMSFLAALVMSRPKNDL